MNLSIIKILVSSFLIIFSKSEIIGITVCSDNYCSSSCQSWTPTNGDCTICKGGESMCSVTNPSSITTLSSLTLYSDSLCKTVIPNTNKMSINPNAQCNILYGNNGSPIGSYKVTNIVGAIISGVVLLFIMCLLCCYCCYRCRKNQQNQQNQNTNEIIVLESQQSYPQQSYPQQVYPQQSYPQQSYPQQSYPQQVYPQQAYPQQAYAQPSYYPQPQQLNQIHGYSDINLDPSDPTKSPVSPPKASAPEQSIPYWGAKNI